MAENIDQRAINAIWKTTLKSSDHKLVLYQLASKHELGEKHSTSWKSIDAFLSDFEDKWTYVKELREKTRLSDIKLNRSLDELIKSDYIQAKEVPVKFSKRKKFKEGEEVPKQKVYAITKKIFQDFKSHSAGGARTKSA